MRDLHTYALAQAAVASSNLTTVATEIGYSRTAVSLYMSDKYGAQTAKLEAALRKRYDLITCKHTGVEIIREACDKKSLAPKPFGGKARQDHWNTCQACQHNTAINKETSCT